MDIIIIKFSFVLKNNKNTLETSREILVAPEQENLHLLARPQSFAEFLSQPSLFMSPIVENGYSFDLFTLSLAFVGGS